MPNPPDPAMRLLDAEGLTLEPQVVAHADEMFRLLSDPRIYEHENQPPESLEWLRQRYTRLETRRSGDGGEQWLNWVVRLPDARLAGYLQASVRPRRDALIAYVLGSEHWGKGIATRAVTAMLAELGSRYGVQTAWAVLKRDNLRSRQLLDRLGFVTATQEEHADLAADADEIAMRRDLAAR